MSLSTFSRGIVRGTLGVENLLELARVAGEPPSDVLRTAGKQRVADLIEQLYQPSQAASHRALLAHWEALDDETPLSFDELIRAAARPRPRR